MSKCLLIARRSNLSKRDLGAKCSNVPNAIWELNARIQFLNFIWHNSKIETQKRVFSFELTVRMSYFIHVQLQRCDKLGVPSLVLHVHIDTGLHIVGGRTQLRTCLQCQKLGINIWWGEGVSGWVGWRWGWWVWGCLGGVDVKIRR